MLLLGTSTSVELLSYMNQSVSSIKYIVQFPFLAITHIGTIFIQKQKIRALTQTHLSVMQLLEFSLEDSMTFFLGYSLDLAPLSSLLLSLPLFWLPLPSLIMLALVLGIGLILLLQLMLGLVLVGTLVVAFAFALALAPAPAVSACSRHCSCGRYCCGLGC